MRQVASRIHQLMQPATPGTYVSKSHRLVTVNLDQSATFLLSVIIRPGYKESPYPTILGTRIFADHLSWYCGTRPGYKTYEN